MKEDKCPIHPEVRLIPVTDEEYGLTTNRCARCDIATAPEKQCPTCGGVRYIPNAIRESRPCPDCTAPAQPVEELEHAHDDTCKAVIRIRNTTIDEGTKIAQALITREKARYCAEVLRELEQKGHGGGNWRRLLTMAIAQQTKIAEGGDEGR